MMKHGYSLTLVLTLLVATSGLALAQQQRAPFMPAEASAARSAASVPAITSPNPVVDGRFGDAVAGLGDVDGDGAGDLLVGAPGEIVDDTNSGRAYVVSGATGEVVYALISPRPTTPGGAFGGSVSGVPDADGDGTDDFAVGAANEDVGAENAGRAYLFSGATGELLQTLESPVPPINGFFGTSVSGVPDIDGDGLGDVVVGAPGESDTSGRIYIFSGATGDLLRTVLSPTPEFNGLFGFVVAGMNDVNGDGRGDVAVGAFGENLELQDDGRAYILDGATGEVIHFLTSPVLVAEGRFGISLARVDDTDGDGFDDLLVAADGEAIGAGQAHLFSGATGLLLRTLESPNPEEGGGFGFRVSGVPDVDGDGRGDLLIGAFNETVLGFEDAGRAYLFSGQTGSLLRTLTSLSSFRQEEFFGVAVAGASDVNGDGAGDLLVGAPLGDPSFPNRGSAYLFSGADAPPVAVDDAATTVEGFAGFADVLTNDFDLNADDLFVESVGTALNGTTLIVGDGVRYTPNPGFVGTDSFTYTVGDGLSGSDEGTVTVTVNEIPENVQPFAAPDAETDDSFGIGVSSVPDVNGDGITDFAIGSADENGIETRGRVYLYDGATGNLIRTLSSPDPQFGGGFGISVAGVSDVNGDGAGDLLVGAYLEDVGDTPSAGRAYLFSGASGILLRTLESSSLDSFNFGWQVAAVPDVDGDAIEDLLIGTQGSPAHLFSGASGSLLQTLESPSPDGGIFGFSVAGLSDIDGDGSGDIAVGDFFAGEENEGAVYLFSGATGLLIRTLTSPNPELNSLFAFPVDRIADISGDGLDDILVGAFYEDGGAMNAGRAYVFDGATGSLLRTLTSPNPEPSGNFGIGLASVADADGDGQEDILVGAWNENAVTGGGGRAYLFSGESGALLRTVESPAAESGGVFGRTVAGVPDLDGDGLGELLIGARGEDAGALNAGRAYLFLSGDGEMEITVTINFPEGAQAGADVPVRVTIEGFETTAVELRYRPTGAPAFGTMQLTMDGDAYTGTISDDLVTLRGVDYFVVLTDGESTVTFPELDPELNPLRLRVSVAQQAAGVDLPPNAEYRMVSVPAVLDDPDPFAVFEDDYGDYGETSWRLLRWEPEPGLEQYAELVPPDSLDRPVIETPVAPGTAFWLAAYADEPFDIDDALSVDASEPATVIVQPGWNQIGNPFAFPVDWSAVLGSDLVQPPAFYDGSPYSFNQLVLDPWVGYFVFNPELEPVLLQVPPIESFGELRSSNGQLDDAVRYHLHLRAEVPERGLRDTQNVFGFAEAEPERLARAEPPPIGPHLRLSAVEDGRRLAHSFRPADADGGDWELEVTATPSLLETGPLAVRVTLDELGVRPADFDLHVLDLDRTAPVVLEDGTFELELRADRPVRRLRLIAGTAAYADAAREGVPLEPLDFALAPAYPNPFAGSATLAYQVAERAEVVLDVFDILGRRVAVLADGMHDAGRYTVQWDGRTAGGARVANGVYLYRLRAGSFTATHKVVLLR